MKNVRKTIAVILTAIMAFSCLGLTAFAADADTVYQYGKEGGYLAIGDSISRGCGCDGFYMDRDKAPSGGQYDLYEMRNVQGALPYQIAQAVGCTAPVDMEDQNATYWPFVYPGMTTAVTLDLLGVEDNFKDEKLDYPYYDSMLKYFGYEGSFGGVREKDVYVEGQCGLCGNIIDLIQGADLITLQLGMCDVFYRAYRIATKGGFLADGWGAAMQNIDDLLGVVKTAIGEMYNGYNYWEQYYPVLLAKIKELNPDATIVIVGAFNVINELTITDEMMLPIGSVATTLTDSMNKKYQEWAKEYGVLYADVSSTEILAAEKDWSLMGDFIDNTFEGTHPSQNGYDYMVRQVLSVLPDKDGNYEAKGGTDIILDIGRFDKVDIVKVNNNYVTDYELDGHKLTVHYNGKNATRLAFGTYNEDGTLAMQSYELTYSEETGYTAERVYGTNDYTGTALKPVMLIFNLLKQLFQKIVDAIKGLFA